jgi:hypothetical protein
MATLFKNKSAIDHHHVALLFAYLAKACIDEYGCEGKSAAMSVAIDFGEARGREMRRIANEHGSRNDFISYLCFSDISLGDHKLSISKWSPDVEICICKCGWHQCWQQYNLVEFGKIYCQVIDQAILRGFNDDLRFCAPQILTDGVSKYCKFIYYDVGIKMADILRYIFLKTKYLLLRKTFKKPFSYHYDNLLCSFERELYKRFGKDGFLLIRSVGEGICFEFPELLQIHDIH